MIDPFAVVGVASMPRIKLADGRTIDRPHPEWTAHQVRWRWLLDSWEGGEAYRTASYGIDARGLALHNLVRHKREYPDPTEPIAFGGDGRPIGSDQTAAATDDDFELRRARTPIPTFVAEAVEAHLSRIFAHEVKRGGDARLDTFWADPTGRREGSIDDWFSQTVAPLLLVLGQLDVLIDHPAPPPGATPRTRADDLAWRLDRAYARVVMPAEVLWWRLDAVGRYDEVLVREPGPEGPRYRLWDAVGSRLYDHRGEPVGPVDPHPFGRPPIVRLFDRRRPRREHVGLPRYEAIAEIQREYYNRDSELILSDSTQAHPLLQGPEDYVQADGSLPIGPTWLLPKKKDTSRGGYEGFDVVDFPKEGAESIRANKADLRDAADRAALLTKPAGASGTTGSTVAQSGVSKRLDQSQGNDLLVKIARALAVAEIRLAELAILVLSDGREDPTTIDGPPPFGVQYPGRFDLASADELAGQVAELQALAGDVGRLPETEKALLKRLVRLMMPGVADEEYAKYDAEIDAEVGDSRDRLRAAREAEARRPDDVEAQTPDPPVADVGDGSPAPNEAA